MRQNIILLTLTITILCNSSTVAQTIIEPEFPERPYFLSADSTLKNLERADAQLIYKQKAMGLGGTNIYYEISSPKSEMRFSKNELPRFFIKTEANIDLSESVLISKSVLKKGRRTFIQNSYAAYTAKSKDISDNYLKLEFKKIKDNVYEILLPQNIASGEYAFIPIIKGSIFLEVGKTTKLSCFGID